MDNKFDYTMVIENLSGQIAQQAQQIALLQAVIQQLVGSQESENTVDEEPPAEAE